MKSRSSGTTCATGCRISSYQCTQGSAAAEGEREIRPDDRGGAEGPAGPQQMISMPAPEIKNPDPAAVAQRGGGDSPSASGAGLHGACWRNGRRAPVSLPEAPLVTPTVEARKLPFERAFGRDRRPRAVPAACPPVHPKATATAVLAEAPGIESSAVQARKSGARHSPSRRAPRRAFTASCEPAGGSGIACTRGASRPGSPEQVAAANQGNRYWRLAAFRGSRRRRRGPFTPPPSSRSKAARTDGFAQCP